MFLGCVIWFISCPQKCYGCLTEEQRTLLQIKDSLSDVNEFDPLKDWISGGDCCDWERIACKRSSVARIDLSSVVGSERRIWHPNATMFEQFRGLQELDLSDNHIKGWADIKGFEGLRKLKVLRLNNNNLTDQSIAPWINNLTSMTYLDLYNNSLTDAGWISNLTSLVIANLSMNSIVSMSSEKWSLPNLQELYMRKNQLTQIEWLSNLTSLTMVQLAYNKFTDSSTLKVFCRLNRLESIFIEVNDMEGEVDPCIGKLSSLKDFDISYNSLVGGVPAFFPNLTSIRLIVIRNNLFKGVYHLSVLANLSQLTQLELSDNIGLEVETESPTWTPSFNLQYILLRNCVINKRSNRRIPTFVSHQTYLQFLDLSYASLSGVIPSSLFYNVEELYLSGNGLTGPRLPSIINGTSSLTTLDISDNPIYGSLSSNISKVFPNLIVLNMSTTALGGGIPSSLNELRFLEALDLSNNNLTGDIPPILNTNNATLRFLSLSNNKLQGEMLPQHSNTTHLVHLSLNDNLFTGGVSPSLSRSPNLQTLDVRNNQMSGQIPGWLFDLPNVVVLLLSGNRFSGPIPIQLCDSQNLHLLDMSNNSIGGTIPHCLNNVTSWELQTLIKVVDFYYDFETFFSTYFTMKGRSLSYKGSPLSLLTGIDFSMNRIIGSIPTEMGGLKAISSMNLSNNFLEGPIPESFQGLDNIESLDLSHNRLTGAIPPGLVSLHWLSAFNVAYNNLSGAIPTNDQFSTFGLGSYEGNPGLCGDIVKKNCTSSVTPFDEGDQREGTRFIDKPVIYYLFVMASYAIGFWGVIAFLVINTDWRVRLFVTTDELIYACVDKVWTFSRQFKNQLRTAG
ncbi:hypothetical protein QJS04_geneDACA013075 [Acorus gramineus]|uniref:Leucine-rich repeat-containing N-terminal plant-type domain-containing protein n=1 Tax=Acorus gramineus TaxID=55184 RepID=A0AAV9B685_ACOGR|nr:hypothetical protein QJS04_geneDACA013075 [Acorus gramineus]